LSMMMMMGDWVVNGRKRKPGAEAGCF